jgi:hypothetical protein
MSQYAGSNYLKLDDVRSGPRIEKIVRIQIGSYDRPEAVFESGNILSLNKTNVRTLIRALGEDERDWPGRKIELYLGKTKYQGQLTDSVLVRPINPPKADGVKAPEGGPHNAPSSTAAKRDEMNDQVPY